MAAGRLGAHGGHVGGAPAEPGTWWYRVRGIDPSVRGSQLMSWSAQVPLVITRPTFSVTATPAAAKRG